MTPVLPSVAETERTIKLYRRAGQKESNSQDKADSTLVVEEQDLNEDREGDDNEEMSNSEEEEENENEEMDTEDNEGPRVTFDMGHLSKEEQEAETKRMEEDTAYDIAPGIDIHVPEDRPNPVPGAQPPGQHKQKKKEVAMRQPRRSARPRADIPARYKN